MIAKGKQNLLKSVRQRRYLNKDFQSLRADLFEYARTYYADRINDFSEASMGGLLLDFAAYVGDVTSFYLDHQFSELDPATAVEDINIERALRAAGVDITGAAPAVVEMVFFIEVPGLISTEGFGPNPHYLPVIKENTVVVANNGVEFTLTEDLDFSTTGTSGDLVADIVIGQTDSNNQPISFVLSLTGVCVSGKIANDIFNVEGFVPFRRLGLTKASVSEILSVKDGNGNKYYEVDSLAQDVVYRGILNKNEDNQLVEDNLEVLPAPYRFITQTSLATRTTTLIFGGGRADSLEDDIIPDPSDFAIPLYGKKVFSRFSLDPNRLLDTPTLGTAQSDTAVTVSYRYGGGLSHNVEAEAINTLSTLLMQFPDTALAGLASAVRTSTDVINPEGASGGDNALTSDELKGLIQSARNAQSRIVTKSDLLARVYTMPSNFGRVFRAGIRAAPNNPLTSQLFIIGRNSKGQLALTQDSLKKNLKIYLNQFRLISDAIDILDSAVINIGINFEIIVDVSLDKQQVLQAVLIKIKNYFGTKNFNIDQPIVLSDVVSTIYNNDGVVAVNELQIQNITGELSDRTYSNVAFNVKTNTYKKIIIPPPGSIFEVKFPNSDIQGTIK